MSQDPRSLSQQRFGQFAERYVTSQAHATGTDLERLVEIAQPQPGWTVLDVATGAGHAALKFAPCVARVIATDITPNMLKTAKSFIRAKGIDNVEYRLADAQDLPFDDSIFDLVTCRIAPHHFADCARFVSECARVLKTPDPATEQVGGMLLVQDHVLPDDEPTARYIDTFERTRDPSHNRAFAEREWTEMFRRADFVNVYTEQVIKQHQLIPWAKRQDCSPHVIGQLVAMTQQAPKAVQDWMQPCEIDTPQATFVNHHIIISGRKKETI